MWRVLLDVVVLLGLALAGCGRVFSADEASEAVVNTESVLVFRLVHPENAARVARLRAEGKAPRGYRWRPDALVLARDPEAVADDAMDEGFRQDLLQFAAPAGAEFMLEAERQEDGATGFRPRFVETKVMLTGAAIASAAVEFDRLGQPMITVQFSRAGRQQFAQLTRDYAPRGARNRDSDEGRQLALIVDGRLLSTPEIRTEITGGRAEITGTFTWPEARRLADMLNAGR